MQGEGKQCKERENNTSRGKTIQGEGKEYKERENNTRGGKTIQWQENNGRRTIRDMETIQ